MYPKWSDIQRLTNNQIKLTFEGFKVNPLMYPKGSDIQTLTDNQVKFAFG